MKLRLNDSIFLIFVIAKLNFCIRNSYKIIMCSIIDTIVFPTENKNINSVSFDETLPEMPELIPVNQVDFSLTEDASIKSSKSIVLNGGIIVNKNPWGSDVIKCKEVKETTSQSKDKLVDFDSMSEAEKEEYREIYRAKYKLLEANNPKWEITIPDLSVTPLGRINEFYQKTVNTIKSHEEEMAIPKLKLKPQYGKHESNEVKATNERNYIQPLDVAEEWVNSEYDETLHYAKSKFLNFAKNNIRKENYTIVYRGYDIHRYLSDRSSGFFRTVVDHLDEKNSKIARLYEWKVDGNLVFILAIDDSNNTWLEDRREFYNNVASKGQLLDGTFEKKSYSILRRNSLKDFSNKFISTWFFKDFDTAKRAIIMKVDGRVQFLKKDSRKNDDSNEESEEDV